MHPLRSHAAAGGNVRMIDQRVAGMLTAVFNQPLTLAERLQQRRRS
jgi:hypothetical protein